MGMIDRTIEKDLKKYFGRGKALVIFGPRQVGKTTVVEKFLADKDKVLWLSGDEADTRELLRGIGKKRAGELIDGWDIVVIDEAQKVEDIGNVLKIIHDNFKDKVRLIATGSSSFDLANKINEPLTGRKWEFQMFPVSFGEMARHHGEATEILNLEKRLLYGYYPNVLTNPGDEERVLAELANSNLYKDVLTWGNLRKSDKLISLLQALAYQVGSLVSMNELANLIGLDMKTVEKYISLLEQAFVIFHFGSFSRNLRNELKASRKFYFYDVGIRNAIINNFQLPSVRADIGHLFENFVIAELVKSNPRFVLSQAGHFWRSSSGQEVDYVFEKDGGITAYEIKWNPRAKAHIPGAFMTRYTPAKTKILHRENFFEELL
jgi:predicted AAA+ superfamily ATPase